MVVREILRHRLLHGGLSKQFDGLVLPLATAAGKVCHEKGSLFHLFAVGLQGFLCGFLAIHLFCQIDIVWLLPCEEGTSVGGGFTSLWIGHLHPAGTFKSLSFGNLLGNGESHVVVPAEHGLQHLMAVPQGKVGGVPPCHFKMRAPKP